VLFHVHTRRAAGHGGDWNVVLVAGDLDMASAPRLRQEVVGVVARGGRRVVLDLTGTDRCDSTGLGVLVGSLKRVRAHGGELRLAGCQPPVRKVLELCDLHRIFTLYADADAAISDPAGAVADA
jgi:anti-sigma B factor antagonist